MFPDWSHAGQTPRVATKHESTNGNRTKWLAICDKHEIVDQFHGAVKRRRFSTEFCLEVYRVSIKEKRIIDWLWPRTQFYVYLYLIMTARMEIVGLMCRFFKIGQGCWGNILSDWPYVCHDWSWMRTSVLISIWWSLKNFWVRTFTTSYK